MGGERTANGHITDGLRAADGRAMGGHQSDMDESSYSKMGGSVADKDGFTRAAVLLSRMPHERQRTRRPLSQSCRNGQETGL